MCLFGCLFDSYNQQVIKAFARRYAGSSTGLSGPPPPSMTGVGLGHPLSSTWSLCDVDVVEVSC